MVEFLVSAFVILILVGIFYERDELELEKKRLEREAEQQKEAIRLERMALDLERKRIKQLDENLMRDKELARLKANDKLSDSFLTPQQVLRSVIVILTLVICVILFFAIMHSS